MKLFNVKFDVKKAAAMALLAGVLAGCGMQRQGQYQGIEVVQGNFGMTTQSGIRTQATLSIQETGSNRITGTWSTRHSNGSFTGFMTADRIQQVILTRGAGNSANSANFIGNQYSMPFVSNQFFVTNPDNTISAICPGEYAGDLRVEGARIIGSLTPSSASLMQSPCTQIDIDVSKFN
jgi:outer membrane lipoprotein-sorting protein